MPVKFNDVKDVNNMFYLLLMAETNKIHVWHWAVYHPSIIIIVIIIITIIMIVIIIIIIIIIVIIYFFCLYVLLNSAFNGYM